MPNLIAYDIAGVQPMTGPTGLIFAMRSRFTSQSGTEETFDEADTDFSSRNVAGDSTSDSGAAQTGTNPGLLNDDPSTLTLEAKVWQLVLLEPLGDSANNAFAQMGFSIEKSTVTAKSRSLKAEYTMELSPRP